MKTEKNRKLKGSVLLTVVSVMALLIIFLTSALVLATAANRRAHRDYSSQQAEYTARAAIDSMISAINQDVNVRAAVQESSVPIYANVQLGGDSLGRLVRVDEHGNDVWDQISIEPVPDASSPDGLKKIYYYHDNGVSTAWRAFNEIKITATVKVGKERKTVSVYAAATPSGIIPPQTPSNLQGLNTAGSAAFTTTAGHISGAFNAGLLDSAHGDFTIHNDTVLHEAENFINGTLNSSGGGIYIDVISSTSKTTILGDLTLSNHGEIKIRYTPSTAPSSQQEVPYLFVEGGIKYYGNVDLMLGASQSNASSQAPYNIFAGYCDIAQAYLAADLYLMDEFNDPNDSTSGIRESVIGSNGGGSHLYDWTDHMQGTNAQFISSGGNIYCNGSLKLINTQAVSGEIRVKHDITVDGYNSAGFPGVDRVVCQTFTVTNDGNNHVNGFDVYCNHFDIQSGNDDGASEDVTAPVVKHGITFYPLADSGLDVDTIYPQTMLKEEIYGHQVGDGWSISSDPADPNYSPNKIVKNIVELRNALHYDATTGEFDSSVYIDQLSSAQQSAIADDATHHVKWSSLGSPTNINHTTCQSAFDQHILVFDQDINQQVTVTVDATDTLVIVLDDGLGINNQLIIDAPSNKEVPIFVNGHVKVTGSGGGSILTKELYDRVIVNNVKEIYEWDTVNIVIYGKNGSAIEFYNNGLVTANAMAPKMSLIGDTTGGGINGFRNIKYFEGASAPGTQYTSSHNNTTQFDPHWVGNAFVGGIEPNALNQVFNNFTLLYTRNGNAGGTPIPGGGGTVPAYYQRYFAEY